MQEKNQFNLLESDLYRFEAWLTNLSKLMELPVELKGKDGSTLFSTLNSCGTQTSQESMKCIETHWNLSKKIEQFGKTASTSCHKGFEVIGVPLRYHMDTLAELFAFLPPHDLDRKQSVIEFLEETARVMTLQISTQFEADSIAEELSVRYEELNLIYDTGRRLGEINDSEQSIAYIINKSIETLEPDLAMAAVPSQGILKIKSAASDPRFPKLKEILSRDSFLGELLKRVTLTNASLPCIVMKNVTQEMELKDRSPSPMSMLAIPVKMKGSTSGFLAIFHYQNDHFFTTSDVKLISSLAEQVSITITNSELYRNLKDFLLSVIKTLVSSIEAKDAYTRGHSERVRNLSLMIAETMDCSAQEMETLSWASLLHDIGKIAVPEAILTKPGKLTPEEYSIIQEHPERGYQILEPISDLKGALAGILHHHEKYNGQGYPHGLKGTEIPGVARIIMVADMYDAITSERSYRNKGSHEKAVNEMLRVRGTELDPEILDVFIQIIRSQHAEGYMESGVFVVNGEREWSQTDGSQP